MGNIWTIDQDPEDFDSWFSILFDDFKWTDKKDESQLRRTVMAEDWNWKNITKLLTSLLYWKNWNNDSCFETGGHGSDAGAHANGRFCKFAHSFNVCICMLCPPFYASTTWRPEANICSCLTPDALLLNNWPQKDAD